MSLDTSGADAPETVGVLHEGLVIAHLGQGLAVEAPSGLLVCQTRRRMGTVTVGDRVQLIVTSPGQGRIEAILPRRTVLTRPGHNALDRPVAANLDQILIVMAPEPEPDWLLVDQFLAACEWRGLGAALVINKIDLDVAGERLAPLADYQAMGYPLLRVSAKQDRGLDALREQLRDRCSLFAGQSGVGKSSLTNTLLPDRQVRTREISEKSGLGRHTTTTATLYHLPGGGDLIDSPGVVVFGLAELDSRSLAGTFRDFRNALERCHFTDCRHIDDKGCAVRDSVEKGLISERRYQRYLKLLEKLPAPRNGTRKA